MSTLLSNSPVRLLVQAADTATEIFLVDSQFQRIAKAVGHLETDVVPGVYKVRFRAGQSQVDRLIEVETGETTKRVIGPTVDFATAAPLAQSFIGHKAYQDTAQSLSLSVHMKRGSGSWLYLFARDPVPEGVCSQWQGISVHTLDGRLLAELSEGICDGQNTVCGLNIEVDPGTYRLRMAVNPQERYEMFMVTVKGWQTQVFTLVEKLSPLGEKIRRASLPTASMFMSKIGQGFEPLSNTVRQVELVRQGLVSGRAVFSLAEVKKHLEEHTLNPMLGIFGGHLLISQPLPDYALVGDIIQLLGEDFEFHPDIYALRLGCEIAQSRSFAPFSSFPSSTSPLSSPPLNWPLLSPPMLRSSWRCLVRASREQMDLIPQGSLLDQVADGLLYTAPWLIHRLEHTAAPTHDISLAEANQQAQRLLSLPPQRKARLKENLERLQAAKQFTALEQNLLNATVFRPQIAVLGLEEEIDVGPQNKMPSLTEILKIIDAPTCAIARAIHSIIHKLEQDYP